MHRLVVLLSVALASSTAAADGVRGQGFLFDFYAGGGALRDESTAPAVAYGIGLGFAVDRAATFAIGAELDGFASWTNGTRRDRGAVLATFQVWLVDRMSLKLGAGTPVGPSAIGDGFTASGRLGYDVVRWQRTALVMSLDVTEDTTVGPQAGLLVGFEVFSHEKTINLWNPPK